MKTATPSPTPRLTPPGDPHRVALFGTSPGLPRVVASASDDSPADRDPFRYLDTALCLKESI